MSSELSTGAVFAERYRVERRIAAGGMGAVYEVVHIETNRRRALKVLHAKFMQSEPLRQRFRQEARVASEIDSEHIVDIFDAGIDTTTGMPFLVMELLRGEDLRARVRRDGALPPEEVVRFLYETCLALEKTHQANIVHRDLKPDNLFLCEREHGPPRVKVLDFGIAKIIAEGTTETQATQSLGTPLYMAPEQYLINSSVSPGTDIFALGLIAYTTLVGKPYWSRESKLARSPIAFALHASKGPKESPVARAAQHKIHLPPAFDTWFFRATAEKQTDRFASAMLAVTELADVLGTPLPYESSRSKSGPTSTNRPTLTPPTTGADSQEAEPAAQNGPHSAPNGPLSAQNGPHSASLLSVRTVGSSDLTPEPQKTRLRSMASVAGVLAILLIGPLVDMIFGTQTPQRFVGASPSAISSMNAAEAPPVASTNSLPSASVTAPPVAETATVPPASSATTPTTTPAKSTSVRPSKTTNKSPHRVIWNND